MQTESNSNVQFATAFLDVPTGWRREHAANVKRLFRALHRKVPMESTPIEARAIARHRLLLTRDGAPTHREVIATLMQVSTRKMRKADRAAARARKANMTREAA